MPVLSFDDAMRVLLRGTSGVNITNVAKGAGVGRQDVSRFLMSAEHRQSSVDKIAWFVWRSMNRHVLVSDSDRA